MRLVTDIFRPKQDAQRRGLIMSDLRSLDIKNSNEMTRMAKTDKSNGRGEEKNKVGTDRGTELLS